MAYVFLQGYLTVYLSNKHIHVCRVRSFLSQLGLFAKDTPHFIPFLHIQDNGALSHRIFYTAPHYRCSFPIPKSCSYNLGTQPPLHLTLIAAVLGGTLSLYSIWVYNKPLERASIVISYIKSCPVLALITTLALY